MSEQYWKEQLEALQSNPVVWMLGADSLIRSFEILAQQANQDFLRDIEHAKNPTSSRPYIPSIAYNAMYLGGLASESLLKGLALSQPAVATAVHSNDVETSRKLWTHNLKGIAELAEIALTAEQLALCEQLGCFIKWSGRYSTPRAKDYKEMMPVPRADGSVAPMNTMSSFDLRKTAVFLNILRSKFTHIEQINYVVDYSTLSAPQ